MEGYEVEELYYLYRQGNQDAKNSLIEYCYQEIKMMIPAYYYTNKIFQDDLEDFMQMIMLRCFMALDSYRPDKGMQVRSFISLVIQNAISSLLIKKRGRIVKEKNAIYSLDDNLKEDVKLHYRDLVVAGQSPATIVANKDLLERMDEYILKACSSLEQQIIKYRRQGLTSREIAKILNKDVRSIYNANYRIQKKMEESKLID